MGKWLWTQEIPHQYAVLCFRDLANYTEHLIGGNIYFLYLYFFQAYLQFWCSLPLSIIIYTIKQMIFFNFVTPKWYTGLIIIHFTDNSDRQCNKILIFGNVDHSELPWNVVSKMYLNHLISFMWYQFQSACTMFYCFFCTCCNALLMLPFDCFFKNIFLNCK